jgi:hypothetical protein
MRVDRGMTSVSEPGVHESAYGQLRFVHTNQSRRGSQTSRVISSVLRRWASGRGDDDLAEGVSFTDVREGFGHLVKPEGVVDVDAYVAGDAQFGERLEVGWTPA